MAKSVYISNLVLFVKKVFAMSELWAGPESITAIFLEKLSSPDSWGAPSRDEILWAWSIGSRAARAETW